MPLTLAFDVYGTLIDTQGVVSALEHLIGERGSDFSRCWREKQLEYSFRRGLMGVYQDFGICTSQALDYSCDIYGLSFTGEQKQYLLGHYSTLPAFGDVRAGLAQLQSTDVHLYAFSNGRADAVDKLLGNAGIREYFLGVVSCDDMQTFKPNPEVYAHFLRQSCSTQSDTWLVSSNPFDVIGAISAGWRAAWVKRSSAAVFDPWGIAPTLTIPGLDDLEEKLLA